jgi:hypothetical protein
MTPCRGKSFNKKNQHRPNTVNIIYSNAIPNPVIEFAKSENIFR